MPQSTEQNSEKVNQNVPVAERSSNLTIAEIVKQSGGTIDDNNQDFDILIDSLRVTGLTDELDKPDTNLTVFAPTDAAFLQLATDLGYEGNDTRGAQQVIASTLAELGNGDPIPVLRDILLYHVSPGAKTAEQIQSAGTISTLLEGATVMPQGSQLGDNEPDITDPNLIEQLTNIEASNGLIQGIDRVLLPVDIPGNSNEEEMPEPMPEPENDKAIVKGTRQGNVLRTKASENMFFGGRGNDIILGGSGADIAKGGRGKDVIVGNGGQDELRGGLGGDTLIGGQDADKLLGGRGRDKLVSNGGDDLLSGGRGKDLLIGAQSGRQTFDGGAGDDVLLLGGGTDLVRLQANSGTDKIYGFELGKTTFDLSGGLRFGALSFDQARGFTSISNGKNEIAKVFGASVENLNSENNFRMM